MHEVELDLKCRMANLTTCRYENREQVMNEREMRASYRVKWERV